MRFIKLDSLHVPEDRVRREFDEDYIRSLADDIAKNGLYHAPVVRDDLRTLVAGECRSRAIRLLNAEGISFTYNGQAVEAGMLPVTALSELDEDQLLEIELHENILRRDISWQEQVAARAKLHELRQKQKPAGERQTYRETASEILGRPAKPGEATPLVRDAIALAAHLDDPDVAKAKSEREAIKILSKKLESEIREMLAEDFEPSDDDMKLLEGDCISNLKNMADGSINIILTDPPYGVGADTFGDQSDNEHMYDDSYASWQNLMKDFAAESFRITAERAHAYVFCDIRRFAELAEMMTFCGWNVWETPLIWYKGNRGILPRPDHGPRRTYEAILFASKGDRPVVTTGAHDVISIPADPDRIHAAQKPIELFVELLRRSVHPGEVVLDAFAGRGTIFPAARQLGVRAIAIEQNPSAIAMCKMTLKEIVNG